MADPQTGNTHITACTQRSCMIPTSLSMFSRSKNSNLLFYILCDTSRSQNSKMAAHQSCQYHIRALRHIRPILDANTAKLVGHALVSSRLDYANSIMYGMSKSLTTKIQRQQNMLARVVLRTNRLSSAGPLLSELHWLPVASRIQFKIATLTHKILSTGTPSYLSSILNHYQPTRQLRSSSSNLLVHPQSKTKFGSLAFRTAAPQIWNGLPADVRSSPSALTFKKMLKTHYFRNSPT